MTGEQRKVCANCGKPALANSPMLWCGISDACYQRIMMSAMAHLITRDKGTQETQLQIARNQIRRLLAGFKDIRHYAGLLEKGEVRDQIETCLEKSAKEAGCEIPE